MIGTDKNRAVLYVEIIFWSSKRKTPPSLVSGKYCPHFVVTGTTEYLGVCFLDGDECAFDEPALGNAQPLYPDTIDGSPETQKALLDKMEGYLNHTQSEEFQKEYGDWSVILRVTLDREPDERILALLSKCPAWAEDYGVELEIEIGGKQVRIVES